jgi:hypothetical protein
MKIYSSYVSNKMVFVPSTKLWAIEELCLNGASVRTQSNESLGSHNGSRSPKVQVTEGLAIVGRKRFLQKRGMEERGDWRDKSQKT